MTSSGGVDDRDLDWLSGGAGSGVGYDIVGWHASTWVLHAMYELSTDEGPTYHERRQADLAAGVVAADVIGDVNLDELTTTTGIPLGVSERPSPPWRRVTWRQLAARLEIVLDANSYPPCYRWFPYVSWPSTMLPPCEGSLDRVSFDGLIECLTAHSAHGRATPCRAVSVPAQWFDLPGGWHVKAPLGKIPLFGLGNRQEFTPSNFWPEDRSWFVYTDYDLMGTKVSGSPQLIAEVADHPALETIDWTPTT